MVGGDKGYNLYPTKVKLIIEIELIKLKIFITVGYW